MAIKNVVINFDGSPITCDPSKSILDNLLDNGVKATFSCKKGSCLSCVLRADDTMPAKSQDPLKPTLKAQGYFLSCQAEPIEGLNVFSVDQNKLFINATIIEIKKLSGHVAIISLKPLDDFKYQPGQFLNIKSPDGEVRSYSIASTNQIGHIELHVKKHNNGQVSSWLVDEVQANDQVLISGPNGCCFYINDRPEQPLLLIGTGTGLAPLLGITKQALSQGHTGEIELYHGAVEQDGLYLIDELENLSQQHANLKVHFGTLKESDNKKISCGAINELALSNHPDLKGWRVYLCGDPQMVQTSKQKAFLAGANLSDILSDPFEMKDPLH